MTEIKQGKPYRMLALTAAAAVALTQAANTFGADILIGDATAGAIEERTYFERIPNESVAQVPAAMTNTPESYVTNTVCPKVNSTYKDAGDDTVHDPCDPETVDMKVCLFRRSNVWTATLDLYRMPVSVGGVPIVVGAGGAGGGGG